MLSEKEIRAHRDANRACLKRFKAELAARPYQPGDLVALQACVKEDDVLSWILGENFDMGRHVENVAALAAECRGSS